MKKKNLRFAIALVLALNSFGSVASANEQELSSQEVRAIICTGEGISLAAITGAAKMCSDAELNRNLQGLTQLKNDLNDSRQKLYVLENTIDSQSGSSIHELQIARTVTGIIAAGAVVGTLHGMVRPGGGSPGRLLSNMLIALVTVPATGIIHGNLQLVKIKQADIPTLEGKIVNLEKQVAYREAAIREILKLKTANNR